MSLARQPIDIVFGEGLDTKTDEKMLLPTKLRSLENGVFSEVKAINKRAGSAALSNALLGGTSLPATATMLAAFDDELLQINGDTLYSYSSALLKWATRSESSGLPALKVEQGSVIRNTYGQTHPDACSVSNITMYAWKDSRGGVRCQVVDQVTGAVLLADTEVSATGAFPRCAASTNRLCVFFLDGANVKVRYVTITAPHTLVAETTMRTDADPTASEQHIDVIIKDEGLDGNFGYLAYNSNPSPEHTIFTFDPEVSFTVGFAQVVASAADRGIAVYYHETLDEVFVAWSSAAGGTSIRHYLQDLTPVGAITLVSASVGTSLTMAAGYGATASQIHLFYEVAGSGNGVFAARGSVVTYTVDGLVDGPGLIAGKAFKVGATRICLPVRNDTSGIGATYFLMDPLREYPIAKMLPALAPHGASFTAPPSVLALSATEFVFPALGVTRFAVENGYQISPSGLFRLTFTFDIRTTRRAAKLGRNLHFATGMLLEYDGVSPFESGFGLIPELSLATNPAGGSMAAGIYQAVAVYEWTDSKGQLHRSAPSIPVSITTTGATSLVNATISSIAGTLRNPARFAARTNITATLYMTEANGTVLYRIGHNGGSPTTAPVYCNPTGLAVTVTRTSNDATIISNELLYTTGGVVENIAPPASNIIAAHKNRLFLVPSENPNTVWYSKPHVEGDAVAFSDLLTFVVNEAGGEIRAIASMDDKLVIFKRDAIYFVSGDGPDNTGANNSFSEPILVSTDVGCTNEASVVLTPDGLMFESAKGIYLLSRGLQVSYIGAAVEDFNAQTITSAVLVDDQNQVRFTTAAGTTLVYDYLVGQWGTFTNQAFVDAVIYGAVWSGLSSTGVVRQEAASFIDVATDYYLKLKTAWIKLASVSGWQRVWRVTVLGDYKAAHTIRMRVFYDYDDSSYTEYSEPTSTFVTGAGQVYQFEVHLARQKAQAISFEIQDTGAAPGQAFSIAAISLLAGVKPGLAKLPAAKRI